MTSTKDILLGRIRQGSPLSLSQQIKLTLALCAPAILSQVASVLLQFIDAGMVGNLGAGPAASIGLVSTTTWIFGGFCMAAAQGFSVQVAHLCGSSDFTLARKIMRQGFLSVVVFSVALTLIALSIASPLPRWLGGEEEIIPDAQAYFAIFTAFLPLMQLTFFGASMLQCSGNMKVPSMLNILMCVMDVILNFLLIFPTRTVSLLGLSFRMPGAGMGVKGAALGTGIAITMTATLMLYFLFIRSRELSIRGEKGRFIPEKICLQNAFGITGPMWIQNLVMRGAHVMSTIIVAPLGAISIAANSLAITAESFCYMPGYGMGDAATTLVGQSLGAGRKDLARSFSRITLFLGVGMMVTLAVVMYFISDGIMGILSSDPSVVSLGGRCLRMEAFAEAGYATAIVAYGACVGAGDTKVPTLLNLGSMWFVRIGLALYLTPRLGLMGYWIAMCIELNVRGALFLWRISGKAWMEHKLTRSDGKTKPAPTSEQ